MRLGIYGGTFDPVHYGHLLAAEQCREQCRLDEVWFVPAAVPPHKRHETVSPGDHRAEMLELATAGHPRLRVSRVELDRTGPSFTVQTLDQLRAEQPERDLFLLMGTDSLADFPSWREPARILALAEVLVVNRGRRRPDLQAVGDSLGEDLSDRLQVVSMPGMDLSASDIRQRVRTGRSIRYMMPRAVEMYIQQTGLYRSDSPQ
jgi:nicotinate-nucleotide adenylyltransferase